jgi:RNA polymerase sigma-70 factor (ECF subfamily)
MSMKAEYAADMEALLAQAGWLRRFARALLGNAVDAEDLAQDTLVAAWRQPSRGGGRAWLSTVARNLAVDRFRGDSRRQRREEAAHTLHDSRVATPEDLIGDAQIHREVAEAVASLVEPFRQTLVMRFYQGLSSAEIARELREPEGTVRWRVKEGLDRVRHELDRRHGNDRAAWVAALAPLLSKPQASPPRSLRPARTVPAPLYLAAATLGVLSIAILAVVFASPKSRGATDGPAPPPTAMPTPKKAAVRLNLASAAVPQTRAVAELPPGPGPLDAQSLAEELVRAIQGNDYDAFVAKGAAPFRAAVPQAGVAWLSEKYSGRLSRGRRVSTLGTVRRNGYVDWFFKIEFSDDGDDALVAVVMDGWQLAGFFINEPMPEEKSP